MFYTGPQAKKTKLDKPSHLKTTTQSQSQKMPPTDHVVKPTETADMTEQIVDQMEVDTDTLSEATPLVTRIEQDKSSEEKQASDSQKMTTTKVVPDNEEKESKIAKDGETEINSEKMDDDKPVPPVPTVPEKENDGARSDGIDTKLLSVRGYVQTYLTPFTMGYSAERIANKELLAR